MLKRLRPLRPAKRNAPCHAVAHLLSDRCRSSANVRQLALKPLPFRLKLRLLSGKRFNRLPLIAVSLSTLRNVRAKPIHLLLHLLGFSLVRLLSGLALTHQLM